MPDEKNSVDGSANLPQQNITLNFHQQQHGCKVIKYEKDNSTVRPQNIASCQELPLGTTIATLILVEVPNGQTATQVQPADTASSFESIIFVNFVTTHVAGFHKPTP